MLDISDDIRDARQMLAGSPPPQSCADMVVILRRGARDPRVMGDQQREASRLAQQLEERAISG